MSAPQVATTSQTETINLQRTEAKENLEMNAPSICSDIKSQAAHQGISKFMITKVRGWLSQALATKAPSKIMGGFALGALLITATALPIGTMHADEPGSPLLTANITTIDYADEFGDVELGMVATRVTPTSIDYRDEFGDVELGLVAARVTSSTIDYRDEFGDVELGLVLSQLGFGICLRKGPIELSCLVGSVDGGGGNDGQGQIRGAAGTGTTGRAPATDPGWQKLSPSDR